MVNVYPVGRPARIAKNDIKLFIHLYKHFRKRFKRCNQFEVALEIKKALKEAYVHEYFSTKTVANFESVLEIQAKIAPQLVAMTNVTREKYFRLYCDNQNRYSNAFDNAFSNLNEYFESASPAAIVQMKKRLFKR